MLEVQNLVKVFPGTTALNGVSLKFENGTIHTLLGKNGAGKSTLVKIISGAIKPTHGKILVDGKEVSMKSPSDAFKQGIATVYQELSLIPDISIGENIFLGRFPKKNGRFRSIIDWKKLFERADGILKEMKVNLDVREKSSNLGVAEQQVVELAKAMSFNPSVLILDEPTSALAQHEVKTLFEILRTLTSKGVAIIYITHRMQEIKEISDKISVLRGGALIGTITNEESTPKRIVKMMFGEIIIKTRPEDLKFSNEPVLSVRNLNSKDKLENISFDLLKGEILGIAGMLGSGRTELLRCIYGVDKFDSGEIIIKKKNLKSINPQILKKLGVAFITENRKEEGLIQILNTRINLCLANFRNITRRGFITKAAENKIVKYYKEALDIKVSDTEQPVSSLSGGNQQKVIIGKWLNINPIIILFDEPTRGIDIQTKQQIFQIIWELSKKGISTVFVSTELEELIEVCTRILIMKKGKITKEIMPENITPDDLFIACMEN